MSQATYKPYQLSPNEVMLLIIAADRLEIELKANLAKIKANLAFAPPARSPRTRSAACQIS